MYTYIRKAINGYYVEAPDPISEEFWEIGTTYQDFLDGKWVLLSDGQVAFHQQYPTATIREVMAMQLTPAPERTLEQAKAEKTAQIEEYDNSEAVNGFSIVSGEDTITAWLTPAERANYRSSIDAAELVGVESLSLYVGDLPVTLPVAQAKMMLAQIQLYADQCYMVTRGHKSTIASLDSIEAVDAYDNEAGYPDRLTFNL